MSSSHPVIRSSGHHVIMSSGHPVIKSSCHLDVWSFGHPVTQSSGHLVIWSSGHLVIWSSGHLVIKSSSHPVIQSSHHSIIFNITTNERTNEQHQDFQVCFADKYYYSILAVNMSACPPRRSPSSGWSGPRSWRTWTPRLGSWRSHLGAKSGQEN